MRKIENWNAEQAVAVYQWLDQILGEIMLHHRESIRDFYLQEERQNDYLEQLELMTEEEREEMGVWLEPEEMDDSMSF